MSALFDLPDASDFEDTTLDLDQQLTQASAIDRIYNADFIQPADPYPLMIVQTPTRINYLPYNLSYQPGTTAVYLPANIANPQPVHDQYRITSWDFYNQFSNSDLPALLFRIEPSFDRFIMDDGSDIPVPMLCDAATGLQIVTSRGDRLRHFDFLPRFIAHDIDGSKLEFWFRLDPRLETNDICMRMERNPAGTFPSGNTLNMRRNGFRNNIGADFWGKSRLWPVAADVHLLNNRTPAQIRLNTTIEVDLVNGRLLKPTFSEDNPFCRIPTRQSGQVQRYFDCGAPLGAFLQKVSGPIPSRRMVARIILRKRLQELHLIIQTSPTGFEHDGYTKLPDEDEPSWWHDNRSVTQNRVDPNGRAITKIDGLTHREYMEEQMGDPAEFVGVLVRNKVAGIAK